MVNVAVVGTGLVGSAFLRQLRAVAPRYGIAVVLIARSSKTLVSREYTPLALPETGAVDFAGADGAWTPAQIAEFLANSPAPAVLVDNTSNEALAQAYPEFVSRGVSVVTPNKKAFSSDLALWRAIFGDSNGGDAAAVAAPARGRGLVYHEATVGAGLPIVSTLNDLVATGDEIKTIEGVLSGTLSYIFNEFGAAAGDVRFSDVVLKAKELGYTEPDPREDLNGLDVARKVTILARLAGAEVAGPTAFAVDSLIPAPLEGIASVDEFLAKLPEHDGDLAKLKTQAAAEKKVLRFVGKIDFTARPARVSVGIGKYDAAHPFASLTGSDNIVSFETARYPSPLVVRGAGAGDAVTAAGVLGDLIKVAQRLA